MDDRPKLYSTRQVADRLGVDDSHVRRMANDRKIGTLIGKQWVFTDADIDLLRQRNTKPGPKKRDPDD